MSDSDRALDYLKRPSLINRRESNVNELVKRCIKGHCKQFFKKYFYYLNWFCPQSNSEANERVALVKG